MPTMESGKSAMVNGAEDNFKVKVTFDLGVV